MEIPPTDTGWFAIAQMHNSTVHSMKRMMQH